MAADKKEATRKRRTRNPEATREAILTAARTVLAQDGPEALSVSRVAHLAGINRGTAYQHFKSQEDLVSAALGSVSDMLSDAVFGDLDIGEQITDPDRQPVYEDMNRLVDFAVENPELARIWLFEVLSSSRPSDDVFFKQFELTTARLANSNLSQDNIDTEALSVMMLAGYFLWPVWVRSHARGKKERQRLARRMSREALRLTMYGVLRPEKYPKLKKILKQDPEK